MSNLTDPRLWLLMVAFLVWIYRAWRALRTLHIAPVVEPTTSACEDAVTVIIPAKNEESNIGACLDHFLAQKGVNLEIIVANDNSTDQTESILKSYGSKIKSFNVPPTPEGWTGKNFAIHSAMSQASGDWLLFTDADTRHEPTSVASSIEHVKARDLQFLTLLPRCLTASLWELIIQPIAMGFTGLWFPIEDINNPDKPIYFANGQYILMHRKLYSNIKGHEAVKGEFLEDFAMMERAKKKGKRVECAFGMKVYGTRMYDSLAGIWRGWRRIYLHAFKRKPVTLFKKFLSLIFFSIVPFTSLLILLPPALENPNANGFLLGVLISLILFILGTSWKTYEIVKANRLFCVFHPIACFFLAMILLDGTWMAITKKKTVWR